MSNGEEEARRRKIIIDSQVIQEASAGIAAVSSGKLSMDQIAELIALDEAWLASTRACMERSA